MPVIIPTATLQRSATDFIKSGLRLVGALRSGLSLTGDELILNLDAGRTLAINFCHDERLEESKFANGIGKIAQRGFVKISARLIWIGFNLLKLDLVYRLHPLLVAGIIARWRCFFIKFL